MLEFSELEELIKLDEEDAELFDSHSSRIETNAHFYHVMQKTGLGENVFNSDSALFRSNQLRDACRKNNAILLFTVVMGNHTHDLIMVLDYASIGKIYRTVNTATSHYIRKMNPARYNIPGNRVFGERPCLKAVKTLDYLFYLPYYFMTNVQSCEKLGKRVPYSCFPMMEKGIFPKPFSKEVFEKIFIIKMEDYLKALYLPKNQFNEIKDRIISRLPEGLENEVLKIDSSKEWI